jgi:hypothetical protein
MRVVRTRAKEWAEASAMADGHGAGLFATAKRFASLGMFLLERQAIDCRRIASLDKMLLQHVKD